MIGSRQRVLFLTLVVFTYKSPVGQNHSCSFLWTKLNEIVIKDKCLAVLLASAPTHYRLRGRDICMLVDQSEQSRDLCEAGLKVPGVQSQPRDDLQMTEKHDLLPEHSVVSLLASGFLHLDAWCKELTSCVMAHFHHGAERGLSVSCRVVPRFHSAWLRPGATFSPFFWPDKIVVLSGPTARPRLSRAESGWVGLSMLN